MTSKAQLENMDELLIKLNTCLTSLQDRNLTKPMPNVTKTIQQTQTMINKLNYAKSKLIMSLGNTNLDIYRLAHPKEISELRQDIANHIRNPNNMYKPYDYSRSKDIPQTIVAQLYQQILQDEQKYAINELNFKIINQQDYNNMNVWGIRQPNTSPGYIKLDNTSDEKTIQNAINYYIQTHQNDKEVQQYKQTLTSPDNVTQIKTILARSSLSF